SDHTLASPLRARREMTSSLRTRDAARPRAGRATQGDAQQHDERTPRRFGPEGTHPAAATAAGRRGGGPVSIRAPPARPVPRTRAASGARRAADSAIERRRTTAHACFEGAELIPRILVAPLPDRADVVVRAPLRIPGCDKWATASGGIEVAIVFED